MENIFIKITFILSIVAAIWLLFIVCKKTYLLLKIDKRLLNLKIVQPDLEGILKNFIFILVLIFLDIFTHQFMKYYFSYDIYWKFLLVISIPIYTLLSLAICNEFFPTIVTTENVCWMCKKIYEKKDVTYYYDKEKILLYCDTDKLLIKREKKYDLLIKILDTNYKKQEE